MFSLSLNGKKIFVSPIVIDTLVLYKQSRAEDKESGGVILGQVNQNGFHLQILTEPGERDVRKRFSFKRDKKTAQAKINYEYKHSNKKTIYLGEWHTHPEDNPVPSEIDKRMILDNLKMNELNHDFILLIIGGLKAVYLGVYSLNGIFESSINYKDIYAK